MDLQASPSRNIIIEDSLASASTDPKLSVPPPTPTSCHNKCLFSAQENDFTSLKLSVLPPTPTACPIDCEFIKSNHANKESVGLGPGSRALISAHGSSPAVDLDLNANLMQIVQDGKPNSPKNKHKPIRSFYTIDTSKSLPQASICFRAKSGKPKKKMMRKSVVAEGTSPAPPLSDIITDDSITDSGIRNMNGLVKVSSDFRQLNSKPSEGELVWDLANIMGLADARQKEDFTDLINKLDEDDRLAWIKVNPSVADRGN